MGRRRPVRHPVPAAGSPAWRRRRASATSADCCRSARDQPGAKGIYCPWLEASVGRTCQPFAWFCDL